MKTHDTHTNPRPLGRHHGGSSKAAVQNQPTPQARRIAKEMRENPRSQSLLSDPAYLRYPAPGYRDPLTGLSRGTLSELVVPCQANGFNPPVRSVLLKKQGATRGIRLIHVPSLLAHLDRLADEANSAASAGHGEVEFIEEGQQ